MTYQLRYLKVTILNAMGLRDADWIGNSDSYCLCEVVGKPHTRKATSVFEESQNPVWNSLVVIADFEDHDILQFTVRDKDWGKNDDLLGVAKLPISKIVQAGAEGIECTLDLEETGTK